MSRRLYNPNGHLFNTTAKQSSIMALSAALYFVLLFINSYLPANILVHIPIFLLGVLPLWFGWSGLVGCMIGYWVSGLYFVGIGPFIILEPFTVPIGYGLVWLLAPKNVADLNKKKLCYLACVYAVSLLLGGLYHAFLYASFITYSTMELALVLLFTSFILNFAVVMTVCPVLIRTLTPRLAGWGIHPSSFRELRSRKNTKSSP